MSEKIYQIQIHSGRDFAPASCLSEMFCCSSQTIRRHFHEMEQLPRYKDAWLELNGTGKPLYNVLAYLDYLRYKPYLGSKNLSKNIPAFSESEVRKRRGDYMVIREA